jgi:hypothetical protein
MDTTLKGKRIRLTEDMNDPQPIKAGEEGTIKFTDGIGQIHVSWDNGRSLAVIPNEDKFVIDN